MTNKEKAIGYMKDLGIFDDAIKRLRQTILCFSLSTGLYIV